jgi:hypothetical protein
VFFGPHRQRLTDERRLVARGADSYIDAGEIENHSKRILGEILA